ncbi:hypothetical protein CTAYLR_002497 [Chrysophaeum taylorii]|uniref:Uncharacterized protein n=1 Tax=Chrysophaeum taylorii TaxID=2483200 RepID=A0AAD7XMF5_9STRA|nr:hypothetical protein CTAYLR_002497 [Chrysophaeum taylorii]
MVSEEAIAQALLASLNVDKYEPGVVGVVLEQMHRAAQAILSDSRDAALHAGRDVITVEDVQLADDLAREDNYSASPVPSRDAMFQVAKIVNAQPIKLDDGHGLRLPPKEYQLTARAFQLAPADNLSRASNNGARPTPPNASAVLSAAAASFAAGMAATGPPAA